MEGLDKIFEAALPKEIVLEYDGVKIPIKVRELSWSERTKILNDSFKYDEKGPMFDFEKYLKLTLKKMIIEAPWGETNEIFFTRINSKFGSMLEKLVPKAFEEGQTPINFSAPEQSS